jgi:hypothetical protein
VSIELLRTSADNVQRITNMRVETLTELSPDSGSNQAHFGRMPKARKSRITNGKDLLPGIDGRSGIARRYRDIASAILTDQGGVERCSESRQQLIRRFAAAAVLAEQLEGRLANGEEIDIAEHSTLSSTLVRLAVRIGIDRMPRDVGMSIGDLMREVAVSPPRGAEDGSVFDMPPVEKAAPVTAAKAPDSPPDEGEAS